MRILRHRKLTWASAVFLLLVYSFPARAALTKLCVEQVRVVYPTAVVYYYDQNPEMDNVPEVQAWLHDAALKQETDSVDDGISYYVLLDISGSIPETYFEEAKTQIARMAGLLDADDSLTCITFGDQVEIRCSGAKDSEAVRNALDGLEADDQTTHLYLAIKEAIALSQSEENGLRRQIMLVVSDGADVSGDNVTLSEVEKEVSGANIPMYALCADYASQEDRDGFGALARDTGGTLTVFNDLDADEKWQELETTFSACRKLRFFIPESGRPDPGSATFLLKVSTGESIENYTRTVQITDWERDLEAPEVKEMVYEPVEHMLSITFSEPVMGADQESAYSIIASNGNMIPIKQVSAQENNVYFLYLSQPLPEGEAILDIRGIVDISMEENPLKETELAFDCPAMEEVPEYPWIWMALGLTLGLGMLCVVIFWAVRKRRKPNPVSDSSEKMQTIEHVVRHVSVAHDNQIHASGCSLLKVSMVDCSGKVIYAEFPICHSAILGRAKGSCDICVDDIRVGRQHCVLEEYSDGIYIRDLGSKNGVFVNGIRIRESRRLFQNDMIRVGDTTMRIEEFQIRREVESKL